MLLCEQPVDSELADLGCIDILIDGALCFVVPAKLFEQVDFLLDVVALSVFACMRGYHLVDKLDGIVALQCQHGQLLQQVVEVAVVVVA